MPHQCTNCGHTFDDGSKEMLGGCPDCGGNKFQFHPGGVPDDPPSDVDPPDREGSRVTEAVGRAATTVRDIVGSDEQPPGTADAADAPADTDAADAPADTDATVDARDDATDSEDAAPDTGEEAGDDDIVVAESDPSTTVEDRAQSDARSQVVDPEDLPNASDLQRRPAPEPADGTVVGEPSEDRPDMEQLREELNSQFESIRIVDRGQYELNLMELYDREEYIIALQENGRYVIEVPDSWHGDDEE